jgi:hypothetical protein
MNNTRQQYIFSFTDGGWNSVYASSIEEAKEVALKEYEDSTLLTPDLDSFWAKEGNEESYDILLKSFW